jgi:sugar lactone lactonase YvrE
MNGRRVTDAGWLAGAVAAAFLSFATFAPEASMAAPDCPGGQIKPVSLAQTGDVLEYGLLDRSGRFLYSDQTKGAVMQIDAFGSPPREIAAVSGPGAIVEEPDGSLVVGSGDGVENGLQGDAFPTSSLVRINPATGATSTFATGLGMANGIIQAPDGTFYATNDLGSDIDRVDRNGQVTHGWAKVFSTNGVVLSPDRRFLYVDQTFQPAAVQRIKISDPSQVSQVAAAQGADMAAGPDDMTIDTAGNLYIAANGAGQIWRVNPGGQICVIASGLAFPSSVVLGPGTASSNLYVVGFGGEIVELPGGVASPAS